MAKKIKIGIESIVAFIGAIILSVTSFYFNQLPSPMIFFLVGFGIWKLKKKDKTQPTQPKEVQNR